MQALFNEVFNVIIDNNDRKIHTYDDEFSKLRII